MKQHTLHASNRYHLATATVIGALALVAAAPAEAGNVAIYGSYWDTEDLEATGGVGAKFSFGDRLGFEARVAYFPDLSEDLDDLLDTDQELLPDIDVEAIPLDVGLNYRFTPDRPVDFFVAGGVSYYRLELDIEGFNDVDLDDEVGYYAGAGIEAGGADGGVGFYAEALYRNIEGTVEGDDLDEIEDEVDLDLGGWSANAGLVFRF
jgi:hypothetical protein